MTKNIRHVGGRLCKRLGKILAASVVAVFALSIMMMFYHLQPLHVENERGETDYVWQPNHIWVHMNEGVAVGRFDSLGFNNLTVVDNPDVLVLGSSHVQGIHMMQKENVSFLLSRHFKGKYSVYNKGIAGHNFIKICQYLPINLQLYEKAPKYVVLESSTLDIDKKNIDEILAKKVEHTKSYSGIISVIQRVLFFRKVYWQCQEGLMKIFIPSESKKSDIKNLNFFDEAPYHKLFEYLHSIEDKFGTEIIIAYHPTGEIQKDGTILFKPSEKKDLLKKVADENGITFVDLTADFEKMYYQEHHVAHGFITGKLEFGHLNKYGHAAMAKSIYKTIVSMEKEVKNAND